MDAASAPNQTIARLTPLAELLAAIDAQVQSVAARSLALDAAGGRVVAEDVVPPKLPAQPLALLDGWALASVATLGAGGYSPAPLPAVPPRVAVGQPMPPGTDCVAPVDDVKIVDGRAEVLNTVNPGDGVLPAGGDCDGATPLRRAGERLRAIDRAALGAAGIKQLAVRVPIFAIVPSRTSTVIDAAARLVGRDIMRRGGSANASNTNDLRAALANDTDAIVAVGGTGQGGDDTSVQTLRSKGRLVAHGVALSPGETAAFGFAGTKPVLLLPGRLDAAIAVWLTLGRRMLARLAAHNHNNESAPAEPLPLARKVSSTVGLAELVPVRRKDGQAEPLATKYLGLSTLARSDGWILVPADSEGYSAGSPVQLRPWP
jgi:molybdopterin biosynthesis enzyme